MPEIKIRSLTKAYEDRPVLNSVDLDVGDKEFVTLLGPSGCGKTTTLMAIAGFLKPDAGLIKCGEETFFDASSGRVVPAEQRNLGIVFQSYAIWPHMTVAENVAFPLVLRKVKKAARATRVDEMLELVELGDQSQKYPHQLSGGQQQRVALARALTGSPSVLLLDEPFSNLDAKLRERSRKWLRSLQQEIGITTVFVTHDQDEALGMSDRVMVMDGGVIQQSGTPEEIYLRPVNRVVADFVGRCNFLDGRVVDAGSGDSIDVRLDGCELIVRAHCEFSVDRGSTVVLALRPEAIVVEPESGGAGRPNSGEALLRSGSFLGDHFEYELVVGSVTLMVQTRQPIVTGASIISIPAGSATVIR